MKNVKYVGTADTATVGNKVWESHGSVIAVSNEMADELSEDDRFELTGGTPAGTSLGNDGDEDPDPDADDATAFPAETIDPDEDTTEAGDNA